MQVHSLSQHKPLELKSSTTREFQELNEVLLAMTEKIQSDYYNLKEFTENASHEIQTPLAIVNSKLELFMQFENLTEQQALLVEEMCASTNRLSRLNKSLILLTRIGNREFKEHEEVSLHVLVSKQLGQLEEMVSMRGLELLPPELEPTSVYMNRGLAEVLVSNLLLNAIRHNHDGGSISISLQNGELCVRNTSQPLQGPADQLFDRFMSGNDTGGSLGIGLALVKKICDLYSIKPSYSFADGIHRICVRFSH